MFNLLLVVVFVTLSLLLSLANVSESALGLGNSEFLYLMWLGALTSYVVKEL